MVIVIVALAALVWSVVRFILDSLERRRRRPHLYERLRPYHPATSVADEAEEWLQSQ
jgi:hypothetical protein